MQKVTIVFLVVVIYFCTFSKSELLDKSIGDFGKCVGNYCVPKGYDKHIEPFDEKGHIDINVDFDILQIVEVNDVKFSIKIVLYIALTWVDQRIIGLVDHGPTASIPVDLDFAKLIWLPDTYIYDMKESNIPKFYRPYEGNSYFSIR